jgi:glyoxylase-like metal-dependent hydrolase (beta-lactamase superfamily II)
MAMLFGKVRFCVLETPGHTPESISVVAYDLEESERTHAVLTGDALFIGDVGRPDLLGSIGFTADELAGQLYDSLHNKLMKLPDETLIWRAERGRCAVSSLAVSTTPVANALARSVLRSTGNDSFSTYQLPLRWRCLSDDGAVFVAEDEEGEVGDEVEFVGV